MDVGGSGGAGGGIISSPGTEDDKFARRRSRRVSFADTTAVHVFDRDEDFETPPEEREPGSASPSPSPSPGRISAGREDGDDTEEDFSRPPIIFMPDVDSSSPGSAAASIASTDDEIFFGPVSANFIQTGRPSDSGMSEDDNHDITMDSRTFSLHFRNIAPPDDCTANSAASLMTPDVASKGLSKELTVSDPTSSNVRETLTDMSLLTSNPRSYDYGKLSPTLNNMMQKIKGGQQTNSPEAGIVDVTPDRVLVFSALEKENKEENLCIGDGISSAKLGIVNTIVEQCSMGNPVSTSTDLIQEDNEMIIDGHDNSQNCNHDHMVVDPGVNSTIEPIAKPSPAYKSFVVNDDLQPHLLPQYSSKDQPSGSNCTTSASSMCNVDTEPHLLDQPPGTNKADASQLPSATPVILLMDAEKPRGQNEVMDTETILRTPISVGLQLQIPQGSISSLRSKRQKLFSGTPLSNSKVANQGACYLGSELVEFSQRTPALKNFLKIRLQESAAASRLPLVEKNELGHQANDMSSNSEDHNSTLSVSSNPVSKLKKINDSFILGTPQRQDLIEGAKVQDTSCHIFTLDSQPKHECNSRLHLDGIEQKRTIKESGHAVQEHPEGTDKAARSPRKSRKDISCVSQSSPMIRENQNGVQESKESAHAMQERPDETAKVARSPRKSSNDLSCASQSSPVIKENQNGAHERTVKESAHAVHECPDETGRTARSPRKSRGDLCPASQSSPVIKENQNSAHDNRDSVNVNWIKVLSTISNATEQVLSATITKLNLQQLDMLSDKLDEVHMARKYKRLSTAVRVKYCCGDKQTRLEEARSLHDKLFYEKAKLQINNMKLAKLQNKIQIYQVGIQECCFLKSKILGATQLKDASLPAVTSIDSSNRQEEPAVLTERRLELSNIQQKLDQLRSSLECLRNIKVGISCDSATRCAEEQLKMRNQLRIIHQQSRLCEVNCIVKRENKRDIILNYRNLLFQRIILNISDMSSLFVNNSMNGTKIGQTFPNMDASVAFNFLFKAEENHRVSDLQSLQKKIMETSLLFGNLIDVLEEIKLSKMESLNLISAVFVLEFQKSQLGLRLCFMSFKSGKKIAFIIDMTDLNRSVYPSEPSELPIKVCEAQTTLSQQIIDDTLASIRSLQPGRTVILRLCRTVSLLIHALPG